MIIQDINTYTKKISFAKVRKAGIFFADMQTPLQWYNKQSDKPTLVCNCSLFSFSNLRRRYEPVFSLKINNQIIIQDSLFRGLGVSQGRFSIGDIQTLDCTDFVSGVPVITENGINKVTPAWLETLKDIAPANPRTIFGWNDKECSVICVDGRQLGKFGIDLVSMPKLCLDNGLQNAVNFDGGGSSMTVVNGQIINSPCDTRGVYTVFAIWEDNMEWKAPNFNSISAKFAQTDKDGNIKVQNNTYEYAEMSAKAYGYAVWEKATKKRIYPEEVLQNVTETEKSVISEPINAEKVFLESIKKMIDERLSNLNG